jgi:hypothetical protein
MSFSLESYADLLRTALGLGYRFCRPADAPPAARGALYLRHDIDYSLPLALDLARVNAQLGVSGTFLVMLRSHAYNALSPQSLAVLHQLVALGQDVGLHVAVPAHHSEELTAVEDVIRREFGFLAAELPQLAPVCAWHNPTPEILAAGRAADRLGGLLNLYHDQWVRDIHYYSDSNLRHSPDQLIDLLHRAGGRSVQLLIHPLIWAAGGHTMLDVFGRTWQHIIREGEQELRHNRWYSAALPAGMPQAVLDAFAERWREEAGRGDPSGAATRPIRHAAPPAGAEHTPSRPEAG